jgi:hypothetical protein
MKLLKLLPFAALFGLVLWTLPASAQPVEYVRVCDIYGTGFFYIPGTDQCYRPTDGQIRFETPDGTVVTESELAARVGDLESDAAISNTLEDPDLIAGERFGVRVNWGAAGAENAAGVTGSAVIADGLFGEKGRLTGSGGLGFTNGRVGGRAGMQLTW